MRKRSPPLIITHAHCLDGFTAAWAAWLAFDRRVRVFHAAHGGLPPRCAGQVVYILDFAYPREFLIHMYQAARFLKVLDHHASAIPDIGDLPYVQIDTKRSGAGLAWDVLVQKPRPYLIDLIEHNDLWQWKGDWEKDAMAWLNLEPQTFTNWLELSTWSKADWQALASDGRVLRQPFESDVQWHFDLRQRLSLNGVQGMAVEAPGHVRSELGHRLALDSGTFGLTWQRTPYKVACSIRSVGMDVLPIARQFGGGGHKTAAGFTLPLSLAAQLLPGYETSAVPEGWA